MPKFVQVAICSAEDSENTKLCSTNYSGCIHSMKYKKQSFFLYLRAVEVYAKCVENATMLEFFKVSGGCIAVNSMLMQHDVD